MGRVQNITQPFSHIPLCEGQIASGFCGGNNIPVSTKSSELIEFAEYRQSDAKIVIAQTSSDRVDYIKSCNIEVAPRNEFVMLETLRSTPGHGGTAPQQRAESYAACVHLTALDECDVWCNNRHISSHGIPAGMVHISDMRHQWRADVRSPFHVVNFYIPQGALDEISNEHDATRIDELVCPINSAHVDTTLTSLALALLPTLARPEQTSRLFVEYAARAAIVHLAKSYGSFKIRDQYGSGGLAPWQERRAKELLMTDLSGNMGLRELASACHLSPSHFSRAFKQTVGSPPHQWLVEQRVERTKQLILNTSQPLSEIALAAGFADQSHFTRVFTQRVKSSPAAWRRAQSR
jgi:AraC family transcriptional regulator